MKILFLDIDGVLNDLKWITDNSPKPSLNATIDELVQHVDPIRIQRINEIIAATEAKIVLCSSTRVDPRMSVVLARAGLAHPIHSTTPIPLWKTNINGSQYVEITRAEEVWMWLIENSTLITNFVILDDQDHNWNAFQFGTHLLSERWVQTSFEDGGLTETKKQEVIEMLNT